MGAQRKRKETLKQSRKALAYPLLSKHCFFNLLIMNTKVLLEKLKKLEEKYEINGQNLESYLDGLYEADFLNYWDYIHLDTLLSLQTRRTGFPDEEIFIVFHQVSELYFRLILLELGQICHSEEM